MQRESEVTFTEVMAIFSRDNAETPERNGWTLGALEVANRQFGGIWTRVLLSPDEVRTVMLPQHNHGVNLVPAEGLAVSEAIKKLDFIDRASKCYQRIQLFSSQQTSAVFLSAAPICDPRYSDYRGLLDRGHRGLTHLDGLHRLIAWGREKQRSVLAYVAGLV
jgi:Family of unknown function (DUF6309)